MHCFAREQLRRKREASKIADVCREKRSHSRGWTVGVYVGGIGLYVWCALQGGCWRWGRSVREPWARSGPGGSLVAVTVEVAVAVWLADVGRRRAGGGRRPVDD